MSVPANWEELAALRPRLGADVHIVRHTYRGVPCYVLQDRPSGKHVRLDEGAWRVAGLMDGSQALGEIQAALAAELGDDGPSPEVVARVLGELHAAQLVECEGLSSARHFEAQTRVDSRQRWRRWLTSPLSQRVALIDPQALLDRWVPSVRPAIGPGGFAAWLATVLACLATAFSHWEEIEADLFGADLLSSYNLVLIVLAYLVVKSLHEVGHALVARAFGGEVHELGVMFLVFLPVPYVDASSSAAFPERAQRMAVAAAGIMVEVLLALLALVLWLVVEPGLVREFARNVFLVGGLSTVLFNGNPLLRFDGYYVLCDALEIPNLGSRSSRYLGYLVRRHACGLTDADSPVVAPGESKWLLLYGVLSPLYRVAVLVGIALYVSELVPVLGVLLAGWAVAGTLALPAGRGVVRLAAACAAAGRLARGVLVLGLPLVAALVAAVLVPVPSWTYAEGVVSLPERAQVASGAEGFLVARLASPGSTVAAGEPLFALARSELRTEVTVLEQRVAEQQARYDRALFQDRASLGPLEEQMARLRAELESARERVADLVVRSPVEGRLLVPEARHLDGRFVRQGDVLGYVRGAGPPSLRVAVRQGEIDRVRADTRAVEVKLPGRLGEALGAAIESTVPAATRALPAVSLGALGGGRIAIATDDPDGLTAAEALFIVNVDLPPGTPELARGTRGFVRFVHSSEPLASQLVRAARQLLLARFGV